MDSERNGKQFSTQNWIDQASEKLGVSLKHHTHGQAVGSHAGCSVQFGNNEDRLVAFVEGNWWCRQCDQRGWWGERDEDLIEKQRKEKDRKKQEAISKIHSCKEWKTYHENPNTYGEWMGQGFTEIEIKRWFLGYSSPCPCCPEFNSLTIPVWYRGKLWDIRHRLLGETDNKYRSHLPGLTAPFFNLEGITSQETIYIVEGEKKAIKSISAGLESTIAFPGLQLRSHIPDKINRLAMKNQKVVFLPDPGTEDSILEIVPQIELPCYMVEMWMKVDDLIIDHGEDTFLSLIEHPRRVG